MTAGVSKVAQPLAVSLTQARVLSQRFAAFPAAIVKTW